MKNIPQLLLMLILVGINDSCTSQNKKNELEYLNKCDTNLASKDAMHKANTAKDGIEYVGTIYNNFIFKNLKTNKLTVKDENGKVLLNGVIYFSQIDGGFQALDDKCEIVYYNYQLEKLNQAPTPDFLGVCGNVPRWKVKIEEKTAYYTVQKLEGHNGNYNGSKWKNIDSISKSEIKDLYFLDKTKQIAFDGNFYFPETIIIDYGNRMGIRANKKTFVFDTVDISNLKVTCNRLYGYFEKTKIKYKSLDDFNYNLAQFELSDGRKGYVDQMGNEYFK